jgi:hypothetical protein
MADSTDKNQVTSESAFKNVAIRNGNIRGALRRFLWLASYGI